MDAKDAIRRGMRRAGLGPTFERGMERWPSTTMRRERRDNRHAVVAMAAGLQAGSDVVDVGAHQGAFLRAMRRLAPAGRALALEPIPHLYEALVRDFPEVEVHNIALSDVAGTARFHHVPTMAGFSGFRNVAPGEPEVELLEVRTERLDDLVADRLAPALIKIDVEGAELQVLRGARETLARHRPMILLEHGAAAAVYGTSHGEVYDELSAAGLRVFDLDGDGPLSRAAFEERASATRWNWLAR